MTDETMTLWTVSVSKETDIAVRGFLAQHGMTRRDLPRFIEDAVKWRVFDQTVAEARQKLADLPPADLEAVIEEAVAAARASDPRAG